MLALMMLYGTPSRITGATFGIRIPTTLRSGSKKMQWLVSFRPTAGSKRKALLIAGAAESTATTQSTRTFRRIARNPENAQFLARGKISDTRLGKKLSALLDAATPTQSGAVPRCLVEAGYKPTTATKQPGRAIEAAGTQQAIAEECEKVGATPELAAKRLREALDCLKVQRIVVSGGKGEPSEVKTFTDVDNAGRLAAIETLAKLRGWANSNPQVAVQIVNAMETVGAKYIPPEKMGDYLREVGTHLWGGSGRG